MVSRLWIPSTGAPAISPAFDASWTLNTAAAVRRPMTGAPTDTSMNVANWVRAAGSAAGKGIAWQATSIALPANKTISGDVTVAVPNRNSGNPSSIHANMRAVVKVVTAAGALRGVLLTGAVVAVSTYANFTVQTVTGTVTNVNALAGDFVVVELGWDALGVTPAGGLTLSAFVGDVFTVPDGVLGDASPSFSFRPWVEFTQDDIWGPVPRRVAGAATEVLDRATNPPRRVAGSAVEVLDRGTVVPRRVAGLAVEVLRARAGQQRIRHLRQRATDTEPLQLVPGLGWRAIRPVPLPASLPKPPLPLSLGYVLTVATSVATSTLPPLRIGDVLVFSYVDGNSFASVAAGGPPTAVPGVVWTQVHSASAPVGSGSPNPQSVAWVGVVTTDNPTLPANIAITAGGTDNATSLSAWRNLDGTLVAAAFATRNAVRPTNLLPGVKLTRDRVAILNVSGGAAVTITPNNPAVGWVQDAGGTSRYAFGSDPLDTSVGNVNVDLTGSALTASALLLILE